MTLDPGSQLGPYEILAPLGRGGMGVVFKARDRRLDRLVAIKVLPDHLALDPDASARFEREARTVAALNHPNIIALYDVGREGATAYEVTELLEGETLRARLLRGPLPARAACEIARQVAQGLVAAHEKGVLHRDLKPENLWLLADGRVKILDFGIAKRVDGGPAAGGPPGVPTLELDGANDTATGALLGSVGYMSPEQLRGLPLDGRCDLFSLGVVLWEMVTGRHPFRGNSEMDTASAILRSDPPPLDPGLAVPPLLERILERCLSKQVQQRFQSARDLAFALEASGTDAGSRPGLDARERARSGPRLRRVAAALVLVVFGALAIVVALRSREHTGASAGSLRAIAVLPLDNLSGDPGQDYFADGMTEALIAELARVGSWRVTSRTSAMAYKDKPRQLQEIARQLDVDAVLEGSVARAGGRVRVAAQLIDARADRQIWSGRFDRDAADVLLLQAEIAAEVGREVSTKWSAPRPSRARSVDPAAYDAYLRGRYFWNKRTPDGFRKALVEFGKATRLEPTWARAWSGLADTYGLMAISTYDLMAPADAMPRAREAAMAALRLDPEVAEPHASLAWVSFTYDWDFGAAEREFRRAIELDPNYATAHQWYANLLCALGRLGEARAEIDQALALDPLSLVINDEAAWPDYYDRRWDDSDAHYRRALDLEPAYPVAHLELGINFAARGRFEEAIAEYDRYRQLVADSPEAVAFLAHAEGGRGERARALALRRSLLELSETGYVPRYALAIADLGLDDRAAALGHLEEAYTQREDALLYLGVDPLFDRLRGEPRFRDLLRRIGVASEAAARQRSE